MYKITIMYPNSDGATFDFDYYCSKHMSLVEEQLKPFGLVKTGVDKGISCGGDQPAAYICIGLLYFDNREGFEKGGAEVGHILRGDIPNFTNVEPVIRQINEVLK
jgi:uncharacterized protein (TIGR02118 family)